ncbi:MAG TPA: winged helix-turn-helix domain-containing protein [Vicinamibacteria bacterium]|nr:winged helix-turn-helix domain-containing protein [Vicinamibacteria bacterium]
MGAEPGARWLKGDTGVRGLRFGPFELDLDSCELWKSGVRVKLQLQPFRVLGLLASQPGRLLTREEIQREVWPDGTFVDFEQALNFCIRQIRSALGDQANTPRFIETLPRRGYRFIAPVEAIGSAVIETPPVRAAAAEQAPAPVQPFPARVPPAPAPAPSPAGGLRSWPPLALALTVGCLLALAALAASIALRSPGPRPVPAFQRLTFNRGYVRSARFAPEGQVLYTAAWEGKPISSYSVRLDSLDSRPLDSPAKRLVAVRGGEVAFITDAGRLARSPRAGGPVKDVLEHVRSADWSADGSEFAIARPADPTGVLEGPARIEYPVGTVLCEAIRPTYVRLAPDGRRVAFLEHPVWGDDRGRVVVVDRAGRKTTLSDGWASMQGLAWSPDSREVWFTAARVGADSALFAVTLDGRERAVHPALGRLVVHDIAPDGRVLLERNTLRAEVRFRGPGDAGERDLSWLDLSRVVEVTPGGRRLLFMESGEGGGPDYGVWLRDTDGSTPVRVGRGWAMGVSPDGAWVLSVPVRQPDRIELLPTGAGETRSIRDEGITAYEWAGWLPDGRRIAFTARAGTSAARVYVRDLAGGTPRPVTPPGVAVHRDTVTPDGRYLAAACGKQACLYPIDGGEEPRPIPGTEGMSLLSWGDGGVLYLREHKGHPPTRILRLDTATGRRETWRELAPPDPSGVVSVGNVALTRDGGAYAYNYARQLSDLYVVAGLE